MAISSEMETVLAVEIPDSLLSSVEVSLTSLEALWDHSMAMETQIRK
jgi:hypothetical protein